MVFYPPDWVPPLPFDPPDAIPICDFILDEQYGRLPLSKSKDPYTCGLSGKTFTAQEQKQRTGNLAKALGQELAWEVNTGTEFDKVACVFSLNTIDIMTLSWAIHRLNGISSPANAAYSADELAHQLRHSGSKALFTCAPLLDVALEAAAKSGFPTDRVYLCDLPTETTGSVKAANGFKMLSQLIDQSASSPDLESQDWEKGRGGRQTAFLCYSSGTTGLPKGVMISHRNVIANVLQMSAYERPMREAIQQEYLDVALGVLPQSHIYGLVVICHVATYRGDQVIVLPKFDMKTYLSAIAKYKINTLYIVPPIVIAMAKNKSLLDKFDLSSVRAIFVGAAPLGTEMMDDIQSQYPGWAIRQAYGLTESATLVTCTSSRDIFFGSTGSIIPGTECKIISMEGSEITALDEAGELWVKSPSITLGYLDNEQATKDTFVEDSDGRWLKTGDKAAIKKSPKGFEHVCIVDRMKELIKVKGFQVAPAELEAHLLSHPYVADCAVIPIPDDAAGELPKAYVVKSRQVGIEDNDIMVAREIQKHVEKSKSRYKWLKGGVEFIDAIPKSPSGKILRRLLRDRDRASRRRNGTSKL